MTEKKSGAALRYILPAAAVLAGSLLAVYLGYAYYFRDRFPFHTYYRGRDVSERSPAVIERIDREEQKTRYVTVTGRDGAERSYRMSSWLGYREQAQAPAGGFQPSPWRWPVSLWTETVLEPAVIRSWDEDAARIAVNDILSLHAANPALPENARLDSSSVPYRIVPEVEGNLLDEEAVRACVAELILPQMEASDGDISVDLEEAGAYVSPVIRSDDPVLNTELYNFQRIGFETITIDMTGEVLTLTPTDILSFYTFDSGGRMGELDMERITAYASELKERYDTYERETDFVTHSGETIRVGTKWDTYGFRMDLGGTVRLLAETFAAGEDAAIEPVWRNKANARAGNGCDLGDTYIEVSIEKQRLWAYKNGEVICTTDVVTGNLGNHSTPRGEFYILYFQRNATLEGAGYSSFVNYWMPITQSGVGLHDASWRSSFGGSIYTYDGSHGCINMPYLAANEIYWTFQAGTPVVIY